MGKILVAVAMLASGCSVLFQDHLQSEYSGQSEPVCTTSKAAATIDGVLAVANIVGGVAIGIAGGNDPVTGESSSSVALGGVIEGLLWAVSAGVGNGWANDCRKAREQWDQRIVPAPVAPTPVVIVRPAPVVAAPPRGFFCVDVPEQPLIGFCSRDKTTCARVLAGLAVPPEVSGCQLVESAWCSGEICAPTLDACGQQRAKAIGSDGAAAECVEAK